MNTLFRVGLAMACLGAFEACGAELYGERWRPQFHFSPAKNWMNDPNGMVYLDGEYHLFYQYNPFGDRWGHMSWGHAVSKDMVHWENLPVALFEENGVMIFSGSAVVDWKNTSGFGTGKIPPLIAIYTGHYTGKPLQNQHIAFSNDRGRTWTKYAGNPVLDLGEKDFRDPKVFWHEPTRRWIMVVSWPVHRKVRFYASPDLKQWSHLSDFGPAGSTSGIWECPDLFPLSVEGGSKENRWVLIVNVGSGAPAGGSGCQFFVGHFDGSRFELDPGQSKAAPGGALNMETGTGLWADWGRDFYAAVSWSDVPKRDGRRLWLGWMSNWQYANDVPTAPWRSAMSVARSLSLRETEQGWKLVQRPVRELARLRGASASMSVKNVKGEVQLEPLESKTSRLFDLEATVVPSADGAFKLVVQTAPGERTELQFDLAQGRMVLDRTRSGTSSFHASFPGTYSAPIRLIRGELKLRLLVDESSLEVFVNDGETVQTCLILPSEGPRRLKLEASRGEVMRGSFKAWTMKSAWK